MSQISSKAFLEALYHGLLGRSGDEAGLISWTQRLSDGTATPIDVVEGFVNSEEYRAQGTQGAQVRVSSEPARFTNDVSQYGETLELLKLWVKDSQICGWVVDVGARGKERSNSYDLMKEFGWHGLLIEANPQLITGIEEDFAGLSFDLVNFAVSDYEGVATLSLGVNDDISSLTEANTQAWGELRGSVEVEVRTLESLLKAQNAPHDFDLLSLDIEGEDIKVLNSLLANSLYRPRWIIIEASHDFSVRSLDDLDFSDDVKALYEIRGQTVANLILGQRNPKSGPRPASA